MRLGAQVQEQIGEQTLADITSPSNKESFYKALQDAIDKVGK